MPRISEKKKEKISEQILHFLFESNPESKFTSEISKEVARDEEFTKSLLLNLKSKSLILEVNKNPKGITYAKRQRWLLSQDTYRIYKSHQLNSQTIQISTISEDNNL